MEQRVQRVKRVEREAQVALALGGRTIPGKSGWVATVAVGNDRLIVDRIDGERDWHVAGLSRNGLPIFFNGELSRCTIPDVIVDVELIAELDEEVHYAEWGIEQDKAES